MCFRINSLTKACLRRIVLLSALSPLLLDTARSDQQVSFNRDIAPILAANCYECHGPDQQQRQADLRLDDRTSATAPLASGATAIVPGNSQKSELIRRIRAEADDRMPPPDHGDPLSKDQIQTLRAWVDDGAPWQGHWSFEPLDPGPLPTVQNRQWSANPIDRFVLAQMERRNLNPARPADRSALIRRLSFDLTGLPPDPATVERFEHDPRSDAYERIVERMLASPHYGVRWGRHWLDVARYADSNGGDENHAYPLAHRYRDYVIAAFNEDLSYDRFIRQQLAGDLIEQSDDDRLNAQRLTATGYLAIGMKILAEQDAVKKRADMVDEQIDTFGRTFLGLSLGCARCHDHKFDPIPTKDYYAMAGIFFSSSVGDQPLMSHEFERRLTRHRSKKKTLEHKIATIQSRLDNACNNGTLREAESFDRGNVIVDNDNYGKKIGIISDPGGQLNFAEYDLQFAEAGMYVVQLRYAAQQARPGKLSVNGEVVKEHAIAKTTGGWMPESQQWITEGIFGFQVGANVLRIESQPMMSHIDKLRLINSEHVSEDMLAEFDQLTAALEQLEQRKPSPTMVMAIGDREANNAQVHLRGSHLNLGDEVQRGFLQVLDGKSDRIPASASGRLQLANWLTDNPVAARLTSRVIVNRLWHWHFGKGLVATPDDFGIRGEPPTHPRLLDYLANRLIGERWSLKAIHRLIVTSHAYKMSSDVTNSSALDVDPVNRLYWKRDRVRLDAESIRDALLAQADQLQHEFGNSPMYVKSQDPSPDDMQTNLQRYEASRRRSVYLPIVRSNVYEFLTLFDFPNASTPVGKRNETTIPTQSLWLMNSPFLVRQAGRIVSRIGVDGGEKAAIRNLYMLLYSRSATDAEVVSGQTYLKAFRKTTSRHDSDAKMDAWTTYCQVLLASNEYLYLD